MVEGADDLLDGRVAVWPVCVDDINVVEAETLEREIEAFNDVFPGEAFVVDGVLGVFGVGLAPVDLYTVSIISPLMQMMQCADLRRNNQILPIPAKLLDRLAHDDF